jgi:hypothetical protein
MFSELSNLGVPHDRLHGSSRRHFDVSSKGVRFKGVIHDWVNIESLRATPGPARLVLYAFIGAALLLWILTLVFESFPLGVLAGLFSGVVISLVAGWIRDGGYVLLVLTERSGQRRPAFVGDEVACALISYWDSAKLMFPGPGQPKP